jgi:hypothetical protein
MTATQSDELARAYARDGAALIVESLLRDAATEAAVAEDRVNVVMRSLEAMAEHQVEAACGLMLSLYPVASELMMHDVCDSIDLWIWNNRTPGMIEHLKCAAASETDPDLKRHIDGLLHIT